ncbi:MAG: DNA cytosine methyltransferase [Agathobacter sp.]|nr:DNA cytosine methyltransferase [Agathobacter sp.]
MEVIKLFDIPKEIINDNERQRRVYSVNGISPTILGRSDTAKIMEKRLMEVKVIGQMDNTIDHTFESANRVYDVGGISPTINCCGGGGLQPKILEDAQAIRMVRTEEGKALRKEYESGAIHHGFNEHREMELRTDGVANTLSTVQKDNYICEKSIVAMRGRNPENPSDRTVGSPTEQRLEPNSQGLCNTLTSVQKDNLVMEREIVIAKNGDKWSAAVLEPQAMSRQYRIRKLTPKECWRLMDFTDEDFEKAAKVNSNTQLYKQAGNSIVKNVLVAILGQMIPGKEDVYKRSNYGRS